jgi:hypothetical protein
MKVELYYFDECPSWQQARESLQEALQLEKISAEIETIRVTNADDVQLKRFIGSPTIRIDGIDIEGPAAELRGYAYGCRVYTDGGRTAGWPSVTQVRRALQREHRD